MGSSTCGATMEQAFASQAKATERNGRFSVTIGACGLIAVKRPWGARRTPLTNFGLSREDAGTSLTNVDGRNVRPQAETRGT
jgi:hypothetical protein